MNFLAHLHIADHCSSHLLGNLLGDFVKGNPAIKYDREITSGIRLHRHVDQYTDAHAITRHLKSLFPAHLRRYSPIALDMFWDHCLATSWQQYNPTPLTQFLTDVQNKLTVQEVQLPEQLVPERYRRVTHYMWQEKWLTSYIELDNISYALSRMSKRGARMSPLAECSDTLRSEYFVLMDAFHTLYPQVLSSALTHQSID